MEVRTDPREALPSVTRTITVLPLKENKRPVGFAPWPEVEPVLPVKPDRKRTKDLREKSRAGDAVGSSKRKRSKGSE